MSCFSQDQIRAIADALGDTNDGLSGAEIGHMLVSCQIQDVDPAATKRHRLYNAFASDQNKRQDRVHILGFIRKSLKPMLYVKQPERFEALRLNVNRALVFAGLSIDATGTLSEVARATTVSEARRRAQELRTDLTTRGVHPDVLIFCRDELLSDNYFHAVLEAVKSIAEKIRSRTGLVDDGAALVDRAFSGTVPVLAINSLKTKSEQDEQKGFCNLLKGTFGMFRNPTAHEARVNWAVSKADAEDLLSLVSLIHRRIDAANMFPRA